MYLYTDAIICIITLTQIGKIVRIRSTRSVSEINPMKACEVIEFIKIMSKWSLWVQKSRFIGFNLIIFLLISPFYTWTFTKWVCKLPCRSCKTQQR